jgi:hypothetical protein
MWERCNVLDSYDSNEYDLLILWIIEKNVYMWIFSQFDNLTIIVGCQT